MPPWNLLARAKRLRGHYNPCMRSRYTWQLRSRSLELGLRTLIVGVVNVTPDSFSDGGKFLDPDTAIAYAEQLLEEGADILDIGGESTRPGVRVASNGPSDNVQASAAVTVQAEMQRVIPVIEGVMRARPEAIVSVDTYKSVVARAAVAAGAEIVNDVSAFQWDAHMAASCAELQCGVVLMHTRGRPHQWRELTADTDILARAEHDLANRVQVAFEVGVRRERIVLDPGFGFGKNFEDNYSLLGHFDRLHRMGFPLMAGTSRKSFVGRTLGKRSGVDVPPSERLYGSLAAMVASILQGVHIVRVHDVKPAVEAAAVADEVLAESAKTPRELI